MIILWLKMAPFFDLPRRVCACQTGRRALTIVPQRTDRIPSADTEYSGPLTKSCDRTVPVMGEWNLFRPFQRPAARSPLWTGHL